MSVCSTYFKTMYENSNAIVDTRSFILGLDGANVDLFLVAHDHHLPLGFVLGDPAVLRAAKSLILDVFASSFWARVNQNLFFT